MEKSSFGGKGFIVCLIKFAEHTENFWNTENSKRREKLIKDWFQMAGDHLIELELPEQFRNTEIEKMLKELLELSQKKSGEFEKSSEKDIKYAMDIVRSIAAAVDTQFGLKPDIGIMG